MEINLSYIKKGDKIICKYEDSEKLLTLNKVYIVSDIIKSYGYYDNSNTPSFIPIGIKVKEVDNNWFYSYHFNLI